MTARSLVAGLLVTLPSSVAAQPRWTEEDVVRLVRERSPAALVAEATADFAREEERAAGLYADPSLSWDREDIPGSGGSTQDIVRLTVPIDFSGRRATERALARSEGAGLRSEAEDLLARAVEAAVLAFYDAVAAGERIALLQEALGDLEEAARVLARREEAGGASGYERARLELETELARSHLGEATAELRTATLLLARTVGREEDEPPALEGTLATAEPASLDALVRRALERPALEEARRADDAARDAQAAARRAWLPVLGVSGGFHVVDDGQSQIGYVLGVSASVPVATRGRDARARAEGRSRLTAARRVALERSVRAEVEVAHQRLRAARTEIVRFEAATTERLEVLRRAADAGYREGRRTLVELLDAQRARTEVRLRRLSLAAAARSAEVRLRAATGELVR